MVHVHQIIRLLAEAREIPAARPERELHLVSGLGRIIDVVAGASIFDLDVARDGRGPRSVVTMVGRDGAVLPPMFHSMIRATMRVTPGTPGAVVTATRAELVAALRNTGSELRGEPPGAAGFGDALFSAVRLRTAPHVHGMGLYREPAHRRFSEEERNLVHIFHAECGDLLYAARHDEDEQEAMHARLSPRQRQTLSLILNGLCDKEIADRLGISRYTVNQYAKVIYRCYAVTSRAQLMARVLVKPRAAHSLIVGTNIASVSQ